VPRQPDPSTFLPLKTDVVFIMMALAERPSHGYGIIGDVDARSDGAIRLQTGALYRALRRLLRDGLIAECGRPAGDENADERRRYYRLTPIGRAVFDADVERMTRVVRAARQTVARRRPGLA
jgi:DNA-binding PadR family transcriptional regulator